MRYLSLRSYAVIACVTVSLLGVVLAVAQQRPLSRKQLRELKIYVLQTDGSLSEIPREVAAIDNETISMSPRIVMVVARLPGGKAKFRFGEGESFKLLAQLPSGSDPGQLKLLRFGSRGNQRQTYLRHFGAPDYAPDEGSLLFKAGKLDNGQWTLRPSATLPSGEYCFSARFDNENFCFGIDPR